MPLSIFDLYTIGIGPSSSHTVGPMRAAKLFAEEAGALTTWPHAVTAHVELFGSLGLTGKGHGSDKAILLGLTGETPETIAPDTIPRKLSDIRREKRIMLGGKHPVVFDDKVNLVFHRKKSLPFHPNGMHFTLRDKANVALFSRTYYSVGGGFVVAEGETIDLKLTVDNAKDILPFATAAELLKTCNDRGLRISELVLVNEKASRTESDIAARLDLIWQTMQDCVASGCRNEGILPGGLNVVRRAPGLYKKLTTRPEHLLKDPLSVMDWVNLYALAVNEENAAGGRVVTAPTNGAAGIVPAVLHYFDRFCPGTTPEKIREFLMTAGAIGILYKKNASISGAEVGCQGEVGVACSMAAAGLTAALGGTNAQIENAAEIGMEHNLGLTCDPIGGLVQIPCIERNAMGAMKAINAARIALSGDGTHKVSLDKVIKTMMDTGRDMQSKYKETSQGGLAANVVEC